MCKSPGLYGKDLRSLSCWDLCHTAVSYGQSQCSPSLLTLALSPGLTQSWAELGVHSSLDSMSPSFSELGHSE
jgi:hypothetical protein